MSGERKPDAFHSRRYSLIRVAFEANRASPAVELKTSVIQLKIVETDFLVGQTELLGHKGDAASRVYTGVNRLYEILFCRACCVKH